jgi:predicted NBD/HSP70 family sugar kinase
MDKVLPLIQPKFIPPLDPYFRPAALVSRYFAQETARASLPLVIGLEREHGNLSRFETRLLPSEHPHASANLAFAERLVKFLLWQRGGFRLYIGGQFEVGAHIAEVYSHEGPRRFDCHFMGEHVYERPFQVVVCRPEDVPPTCERGLAVGGELDGCRIGFDLGASDRKASALMDGQVLFSEEVIWEPRKQADPQYHFSEILSAIRSAAAHLPRLDAIGGSSAGIYIDNRPMVASLFRSIPPERFDEVRSLFEQLQQELGVPLVVINDGDVAALAGAMELGVSGILGIALGSSEAAGYVDGQGQIRGWLNELCFAPLDYNPEASIDEWSGDRGCGSTYFSQQYVFRLAPQAGFRIPEDYPDAEKLKFVQEKLETGHPGARQIWQSMGIYLGYGLAHYATFYDMKHILIMGRCTSGQGGTLLLEGANAVLQGEFPELAARLHLQLPDEKSRRVGQAIAAASLPVLPARHTEAEGSGTRPAFIES